MLLPTNENLVGIVDVKYVKPYRDGIFILLLKVVFNVCDILNRITHIILDKHLKLKGEASEKDLLINIPSKSFQPNDRELITPFVLN